VIGRSLAHYRITAALGAGGMGEVYRATDTRLGRDVALKVLPEAFASDPDRLARFEREAKLLASLNHPNIAHVYGFESATLPEGPAVHFLAMELVEGEDLAERLKRGVLPVDEALAMARQIAEALEEAHEKGVVHRDLKPANIRVTAEGKVKVLDFGLAKAWAGDGEASASSAELSHSPTLTRQGTEAGMILGTAAYMSPEQARGKAVDKRADIWAFGVVLFEMLTGRRLFPGETVSDVLAAVLRADVDWTVLPPGVPAELRRLVRRCLERDRRNRLHDIADARIALEETLRGEAEAPGAAPEARSGRAAAVLPWALAALAGAAALGLGLTRAPALAPGPEAPTVFGVLVPPDYALTLSQSPLVDISADGRTLLFAAEGEKGARAFRRSLDRMAVTPIEGTGGAENPVLSPDGRFVAFFADKMLRRVPAEGGAAVTVAPAPAPRGVAWERDGSLVFSPVYNSALFRVSASGGAPVALTKLDVARGERTHRWPQLLPDGRTLIFTVGLVSSPGDYDGANVDAQRLDTGERRTVVRGARMARYSALGYLVYQRKETLQAVRFDPERLETIGDPFTIQEGVGGDVSSGSAYFAVSDNGTLAVAPRTSTPKERLLALVDRAGHETLLNTPPLAFNHLRVSPDGTRMAFAIGGGAGGDDDIYTLELGSQRLRRLTFGEGFAFPLWSPDGRSVLFTNGRGGETGIQRKAADGGGPTLTVATSTEQMIGDAWFPDGRTLAVTTTEGSIDIQSVDTHAGGARRPLIASPAAGEFSAAISPDGRYVAYTTTETGTEEVMVETLPPGGGKWQVSVAGGSAPAWSRDGQRLYFVTTQALMEADVSTAGVFATSVPRLLLTGPYDFYKASTRNYDVGPDGRLALVKRPLSSKTPGEILVLEGWSAADPGRRKP
jgi:Tol biopolymer transport system component/tRNA A-37 threonylcarbamoyl transferase component Bud32